MTEKYKYGFGPCGSLYCKKCGLVDETMDGFTQDLCDSCWTEEFDPEVGEEDEYIKPALVITSCSGKKRTERCRAGEMYLGKLFTAVKKFAESRRYDIMILSAKYGLINREEIIYPYEQELRTRFDIDNIAEQAQNTLRSVIYRYERIYIIMGQNYRKVFGSMLKHPRIRVIMDPRGIGGMLQKINKMREI